MAVHPGEELGAEIHIGTDQFFRIEEGTGKSSVMGDGRGGHEQITFLEGDAFQVPAGTEHNVIATSKLKFYTIYSPPTHNYDVIDVTKDDARIRELGESKGM